MARTIFSITILIFFTCSAMSSHARPLYLKVFKEYLRDLPQGSFDSAKCTSCHAEGQPRRMRTVFMVHFASVLVDPNQRDPDRVKEAFLEAIEIESIVDGKTYHELLLEGLAPNAVP